MKIETTLPGLLSATLLAVPTLFGLPQAATAQDDGAKLSGNVRLGWRSTDVSGAEGKYRQHVDLDDGARLFALHLELVPGSELVDLVQVDMNDFGGDPYEGFDLRVRKFGRYDLQVQRRESSYFYEDFLIDPADAVVSLSNLGDLHHFDFERVQDRVALDLFFDRDTSLKVFFDRFTKRGEQTTVFDISRDEFELDQRIDESMNALGAALTHRFSNGSVLTLSETVREYDNLLFTFLPGFSLGENPTNGTTLDFYFLDQPYDFTTYEHRVAYNLRPNDRLAIDLSALVFDLEQDARFDEEAQGTTFTGAFYSDTTTGDASFDRQTTLLEAELSYLLNERWALVGGVGHRDLDQDADQRFGAGENLSGWQIETTSLEAGLQVAATSDLTVTFGALVESRDVTSELVEDGDSGRHEVSTDHTGGFLRLAWSPRPTLSLGANLERSSIDDPFTLTSPTDRTRLTVRGRARLDGGFFVSGEARIQEVENDATTWVADQDSLQLDVGRQTDRYEIGLGYRYVDTQRSIGPELDGATFLVPVAYDSDTGLLRGHATVRANDRVRLGLDLRSYEANGSFELERDDHRAFVEVALGEAYLVHLGLRTIDYSESLLSLNDYDADILELSLGYRWN